MKKKRRRKVASVTWTEKAEPHSNSMAGLFVERAAADPFVSRDDKHERWIRRLHRKLHDQANGHARCERCGRFGAIGPLCAACELEERHPG